MDSLPDDVLKKIAYAVATDGWDGQRNAAMAACATRSLRQQFAPLLWPVCHNWYNADWHGCLPRVVSDSSFALDVLQREATDATTGKARIWRKNLKRKSTKFHRTLAAFLFVGLRENREGGPGLFFDSLRASTTCLFAELVQELCHTTDLTQQQVWLFCESLLYVKDWPGHQDQPTLHALSPEVGLQSHTAKPFPLFLIDLVEQRSRAFIPYGIVSPMRLANMVLSSMLVAHSFNSAPAWVWRFILP